MTLLHTFYNPTRTTSFQNSNCVCSHYCKTNLFLNGMRHDVGHIFSFTFVYSLFVDVNNEFKR
eukprot:m.50459 g.50459  ORF g.50459 m.50459 type:complete len:63 (-) comp7513_c0_seq1:145-333(-)